MESPMFELEQSKKEAYKKFISEQRLTAIDIADPQCNIDFQVHKDAIIYYSLSEENDYLSRFSFFIMNLLTPSILQSFLNDDALIEKVALILSKQVSNNLLVSRIGAILMNVLIKCPDVSVNYIPLLFNLLKFLDNENVYELMKLITSPKLPVKSLRESLCKMGFGSYLLHELSDDNPVKVGNVCFIIRNCYKNQDSIEYFSDTDVVNALTNLTKSKDVFILNKVWQSITALCSEKTIKLMDELLEIAKTTCIHEIVNIHIYNVYIWDFLGKIIKITKSEAISSDQELIQTSLNLVISYQDNSNLQGALFRFLRNSLEIPSSLPMIIQFLVPFMSSLIQENVWNAAIANCKLLFTDLKFAMLSNRQLSKAINSSSFSFADINLNFIEPYFLKINGTYGGESNNLVVNRQMSFESIKCISES